MIISIVLSHKVRTRHGSDSNHIHVFASVVIFTQHFIEALVHLTAFHRLCLISAVHCLHTVSIFLFTISFLLPRGCCLYWLSNYIHEYLHTTALIHKMKHSGKYCEASVRPGETLGLSFLSQAHINHSFSITTLFWSGLQWIWSISWERRDGNTPWIVCQSIQSAYMYVLEGWKNSGERWGNPCETPNRQ